MDLKRGGRKMKVRYLRGSLPLTIFLAWIVMPAFVFAVVLATAAEIQQIKPEEVKKLIESKKKDFVVVDTQPKGAYDLGHIKGAVNFPWGPDLKSPGKLPKNKMLILYCDCAHEEDSTDTATQLMEKWGYSNLRILEGGWGGWQKLGYPIEKK
jgi:rhodanese-related sulfurtransferase